MNEQQAIDLVKETFESPFDRKRYIWFLRNLLNTFDEAEVRSNQGSRIPESFRNYVEKVERIGKYTTEGKEIMLFVVHLKRETSIERARTMQRNLIAWYLNYGDESKDAALVAFVSPNGEDWRFSLVKLEVKLEADDKGGMKVVDEFTPAKRWSFLVGANEKSHTAQGQFQPILEDEKNNPTLEQLEAAFNIEKVTNDFFKEYRRLFMETKQALDKAVKANPATLSDFELKGINTVDLAKKLLGQIIFLYYLQKKGWFGVPKDKKWGEGSKTFLRELFTKSQNEKKNFFNDILEPLFYEALRIDRSYDDHYYKLFDCKIPFLNGGLFDPMNNYDWVKTEILLSNTLFSHKTKDDPEGDGILDVFDLYNFTVKEDEPFEKEVAIDPELLGKAYEKFNAIRPDNYDEFLKALKSGKKGEESKFNKQYGVYYTPREIVHYMCQQSLINYLYSELNPNVIYQSLGDDQLDLFGNAAKSGQLDLSVEYRPMAEIAKEEIALLIQHGENWRENEERVETTGRETDAYSYKTPESIRENASLIDEKLAAIKVCDPAVGSGAFPVGMMSEIVRARDVLKTWTKTKKTVYDFKRECIENSLYGVDIDAGAVEIAKLRLWLSLIVDEDDIQNIKPLPNLDYKIVQGNSLVGFPENWGSPIEKEIEALIHQHFNETSPTKKDKLKTQIDEKIESRYKNSLRAFGYQVAFDFRTVFSEVFHGNGGFDIVIANPPYVRQEEIKELKATLQKQFECYTGMSDLYVYFFEKGVRLLRNSGVLAFISSNKYFRAGYGEKLRSYLGNKTRIIQVIDFGDAPVFDAIAYPSILVTQKVSVHKNQFSALVWKLNEPLDKFQEEIKTQAFIMSQSDLTPDGWRFEFNSVLKLLEKMKSKSKGLDEYVSGKFYRGIVTGLNEAFVIDSKTYNQIVKKDPKSKEILKPFIRGRDVKRWDITYPGLYLCYIGWETPIKNYPAVYEHIKQFEKQLKSRPEVKEGRVPWYALSRYASDYWQEFSEPKIVYPNICKRNEFAWDEEGVFTNQKAYIIPGASKYLLGVLNSSSVMWLFTKLLAKLQNDFFEPSALFMNTLPIPLAEKSMESKVEMNVNRILAAKRANPAGGQADTSKLENEIDQLVYQLYGLTQEEIEIVEGKG